MAETVAKRSYGDEEIERGLLALASTAGNSRRASRLLADDGMTIPHATLKNWMTTKSARYLEIRAETLPQLQKQAAARHRALEDLQLEVSMEFAEDLRRERPLMTPKDKVAAMSKLDIGTGIHA